MKAPSPLLGFNNNVRHKGRVFHIQTEDSGVRHPHIITHLFADGGRILKTTKTSYAEHIGQDRMADTVRGMMQEQHKAMFIALRDGQFDYLFDENASPPAASAPAASAPAAAAAAAAAAAPPPPAAPKAAPAGHVAAAAKAAFIPPSTSQASMPAAQADAIRAAAATAATASAMKAVRPSAAAVPAVRPSTAGIAAQRPIPRQDPPAPPTPPAPPAAPPPLPRKRASRPKLQLDPAAVHARPTPTPDGATGAEEPSIDLDLDALERAAAEAQTPFFQQIQDLPPPPAAVLGNKAPRGGYSVRQPTRPNAPGGLFEAPPPPRRSTPPIPPPSPSAPPPARYAPSRPAAIFATTRPPEGASIFGEDLISEKSLDEVILSYLAEDLEGPIDKK